MSKARAFALQEQRRLFGNAELPEICMRLRAGVNGSADEWYAANIIETLSLLSSRLRSWVASTPRSERFDNAVKEMVAATIAEVNEYGWWKS